MARDFTVSIHQNQPPAGWNMFVANAGGSIFQTTFWADYWRAYLGASAHFVTVCDAQGPVAQLLALEMLNAAESAFGGRGRLLRHLIAPLLSSISWREGPVLSDAAPRARVVASCLDAIRDLATERRALGIESAFVPLDQGDDSLRLPFSQRGYRMLMAATVRIDLRQPLDAIWAGLKQGVARTPIRKAQRQGVQLIEVRTTELLKKYYALVCCWRRLNGQRPYSFDKFSLMFEHMRAQTTIFLAENEGEPMAAAGLWHFGDTAYFFTPAQSPEARARRVYAGDFIVWEMIRWCQEHGLRSLDLSGVNVAAASHKEAGIRRFKEKWGGCLIEYPMFTLPLAPRRRAVVDGARAAWHQVISATHGRWNGKSKVSALASDHDYGQSARPTL